MWRLYLELATLVVLAFAVGAGLAALAVRLLVEPAAPGDELPAGTAVGGPGAPGATSASAEAAP